MKRVLAAHALAGSAALVALAILAGCVMVNSTSEIDADASLMKYRASEQKIKHSSSNTVSNSAAWEGGGTLDANMPAPVPAK